MMSNPYITHPITIVKYNPINGSEIPTNFGSKTGGNEAYIDDIEELLGASTDGSDIVQSIVNPVAIQTAKSSNTSTKFFPEDNIHDVRLKIFASLGIPLYRQHIFWYNELGVITVPYRIKLITTYTCDIRTINDSTGLLGLNTDRSLYANRDSISIESYDNFVLLHEIVGLHNNYTIFVTDLADIMETKTTQMYELARDKYQLELFYYAFIVKFWPQLSLEAFTQLITNEPELELQYPLIAPNRSEVNTLLDAEARIIEEDYKHDVPELPTAITAITMRVTGSARISMRNLFDKLETNENFTEIRAADSKYLLRKRHLSWTELKFPSHIIFRDGLTLCGRDDIFINIKPDGTYYVASNWHEEDEHDFESIQEHLDKVVKPILAKINSMDRTIINGKLRPFVTANIAYMGLSASIYWKRVLVESAYRQIRNVFNDYIRGGIIAPRSTTHDRFEFTFRKGMHKYDTEIIARILSVSSGITLTNHYAHLVNAAVRSKWVQNYGGRVARAIHRTTDVKFEIVDVHEDEFPIFKRYIAGFIRRASLLKLTNVSSGSVKKIRKLREHDPELYNTKKHGSDQLYSIKCQNPRQPTIYTDDEVASMTKSDRDKLIQYWNFTFQKPAYYSCSNKDYPNLSFLVGIHPKGYCLPCCSKKAQTKKNINATCLKHHTYSEKVFAELSRHIVSFGKHIEPGRLSNISHEMRQIFIPVKGIITDGETIVTKSPAQYFLFGITQGTLNENALGLFNCVKEATSIERLEKIIELPDEILQNLRSTQLDPIDWMIEMLAKIKVGVIIFDEDSNMMINTSVKSLIGSDAKFVIVVKVYGHYYPMFYMSPERYFGSNEIISTWYVSDSPVMQTISDAIPRPKHEFSLDNIRQFCAKFGWDIVGKRTNIAGRIYGLIVAKGGGFAWMPCDYSQDTSSIKPAGEHTLSMGTLNNLLADLAKFLNLPFDVKSQHVYNGKITSLTVMVGTTEYEFHVTGTKATGCSTENVSAVNLASLNEQIVRQEFGINKRSASLSMALYHNYLYQLLLMQFMTYIEEERNDEIRDQILQAVALATSMRSADGTESPVVDVNLAVNKISPMLKDFPTDLMLLDKMIGDENFVQEFKAHRFHFDAITINRLRSDPNIVESLMKICAKITTPGTPELLAKGKSRFPNIYSACDDGYCKEGKLIVDQPLRDFVEILAADIKNPLRQWIFEGIWDEVVTNYFDFIERPTEHINIYKL